MYKNFKTKEEVLAMKNPAVFDVRFRMDDLSYGENAYKKEHYKGSAFLDLAKDLSGEIKTHGGRHPLPKKDEFQKTLRRYGLKENQKVVVYDHGDNVSAARLWWLLKYFGIEEVYVLLGGFSEFKENELTSKDEMFTKGDITLKEHPEMIATYHDVKSYVEGEDSLNFQLVDSRDENRYLGVFEPIDFKKGHIPKALNVPYKVHFLENGYLKPNEALKKNFKEIDPTIITVFYCGSGVTACSNIMVFEEIGLTSKLYPGSFSDYISYHENQVVK